MSAPLRLADTAQTPAERQVALAASVEARPVRLDGWDGVLAVAATRPRWSWAHVAVFVASFVLGATFVLALQRPEPTRSAHAEVKVAPGAKWSSASPNELELQAGRLWMAVPSADTVRVKTPHAVLEITRSRFLAEVTSGGTVISVEEGEVLVRSGNEVRRVRAGESLTWPPAPEIPSSLLERTRQLDSRCGAEVDCLREQASGEGLEAEVSLYELGVVASRAHDVDGALRAWRESLTRFPQGVLHPEVRLAVVVELVTARRLEEARVAAREFEVTCPGDPRVPEVRALVGRSSSDSP